MKNQIMQAATALFSAKGYYQTGMDEVAQRAGVAKGTLYYHFTNKSQLFCETVVAGIDGLGMEVARLMAQGYAPRELAQRLIALFVDICVDYAGLADMVMNELSAGIDAGVLETVQEAKARFLARVSSILREGQQAGVLRPAGADCVAAALVGFVYAYCKTAFEREGAKKDDVVRSLTSILLHGLLY